jgi:hypothetical protein
MGAMLILHFVDDEQVIGRFAAGSSLPMRGNEADSGFIKDAAHWASGFAPFAAVEGVVEPFFQTQQAPTKAISCGSEDHVAATATKEIEHVHQELGHGFVLTALAREHKEEFMPVMAANAVYDCV